ncbi:hypothetical protein [Pseudomonas sp.]|uniref:hypothetical protein n=1 Tax=Pseudomonas sp. TaxID=306 RepID=UPI00258B4AF4|nr:hypothetical protein [Pseudomonas sp.]
MAAVTFKAFRGMVPRTSERLLSPNYAQRATNCKITSGALDPLDGPLLVSNVGRAIATLFRYRHFIDGAPVDNWLTFEADTDVVLSPLANDEQGRVFYTSEAHEPRYATYDQIISGAPYPGAWFALGIPSPVTAPSVVVTGGSGTVEDRSYAYTFALASGEESGPSPASAILSGFINGSWDLSALDAAPPNSGTVTAASVIAGGRVRVTLDSVFGLAEHVTLTLAGVVGMTDLNGSHRIANITGSQVDVVLTTAQTYTSGGTWARDAAIDTAGMVKRIYRSVGSTGDFAFVAEIAAATTTYSDTIAGTSVTDPIVTAATLPPPADLTCLVTLPNGCLAGIAGNEVCFSYPYRPNDWPLENRYAFSGRGVALVPAGTSVILMTDGYPLLISGTDPEAMSPSVMETYAPCVSKRGAVNVGGGALYPSYDGLYLAAPGAVTNLTKRLYREDEWKVLNPATFNAAYHDGQYYAGHDNALGRRLFLLDVSEPDSSVSIIQPQDALLSSPYDGELYLAIGTKFYIFDKDGGNSYLADWVSPNMQIGKPTNFSFAQVHADFNQIVEPDTSQAARNAELMAAGADAVSGHLLGGEFNQFEINGSNLIAPRPVTKKRVQFTLFKDGVPVFTKDVGSLKPFRLPSGYKSEVQAVGVSGSVRVHSVSIAESTAELQGVS